MKKLSLLLIIIIIIIITASAYSQTVTIYEEDFESYSNGVTVDLCSGCKWIRDNNGANPDQSSVYRSRINRWSPWNNEFAVENTNGGTVVWRSAKIEINNYSDISISVDLSESGKLENADIIWVYYILNDNGTEIQFASNGYKKNDFTTAVATQTGLNGSTLQIIVKMTNNDNESFSIDNVKVIGTGFPRIDYTFASSNTTYNPISGTIVSGIGDDTYHDITIPFSFPYAGENFTECRVSSNGWVQIGTDYDGTGLGNNLSNGTFTRFLAPLWDDLDVDGSSKITYTTEGTSPAQQFVIQYENFFFKSLGNERQTFQVRLFETTGDIQFIYNTMTPPGAATSMSIGINDQYGGNDHFISVTPAATPIWSYTNVDNNITGVSQLSSGIVYTFAPFQNQTFSNFQSATIVLGQENFTDQKTNVDAIHGPGTSSSALSVKNVFIAGSQTANRVMLWNTMPTSNGTPCDIVLGQPDFYSSASGCSQSVVNKVENVTFSPDGNKILVADGGNNRVLIWNSIPTTSGVQADVVIGQENFGTNTSGIGKNKFNRPIGLLVTPSGKLLITDSYNNRVLIYNSIPTENGTDADFIIGQSSFYTKNNGTDANELNGPWDCGISPDGKLVISDCDNHRILIYNTIPTSNGASADYVVGQTGFGSNTSGTTANKFNFPGVTVSKEGQMAMGDYSNNRVVIYNTIPTSNGASADIVLGQDAFGEIHKFSNGSNETNSPTNKNMYHPYTTNFDLNGRLIVNGRDMNRLMIFGDTPSETADLELSFTNDNNTPCMGMPVEYTLSIKNNGPDAATHVVATSALPNGFTMLYSNISAGRYNSESGYWTLSAIPANTTETLTLVGTVDNDQGGETITAFANIINSLQADPDFSNNAESADIVITDNHTPEITNTLDDQGVDKNQSIILNLSLSDVDNDNMTVTVTSSDQTIIKDENLVLSGTGSYTNGTIQLTITPETDQIGETDIIIEIADNGPGDCSNVYDFKLIVGNVWIGTTTDWNLTTNWVSGAAPSSLVGAIIPTNPSGGNFPIISSSDATCKELIIENNAALTINNAHSLQVIDYTTIAAAGKLFVQNGSSLTIGGDLTLDSDASGTASLVDLNVNGNITVTGTARVKRYLTPYAWHYISFPVVNSDPVPEFNYRFMLWNEHYSDPLSFLSGWEADNPESLTQGKGNAAYFYTIKTLTYTGELNTGTIDIPVSYHNQGNILQAGWNLVGNPYPCGLNANDFINANKSSGGTINSSITGTIYFWDEPGSSDDFITSDYASYNLSGFARGTGSGTIDPDKYISSGQGFFVQSISGATQVTFTNSMRENENSHFFKSKQEDIKRLNFCVVNPDNMYNEILIAFTNKATEGVDIGYDGEKKKANTDLALYSLIQGKEYVIQGLPAITENVTVPIGIDVGKSGNHTFEAVKIENFGIFNEIILEDLVTGQTVNLKETSYTCYLDQTETDRFVIHFNLIDRNTTTWTGNNNTDNWSDPLNWDNGIPKFNSDVIIAIADAYPVIRTAYKCHSLAINPAAELTIELTGELTVYENLKIGSNKLGTGKILTKGTVKVLGESTVELYLASPNQYYYVSSPVNQATARVFGTTNELSGTALTDRELYYYDGKWKPITNDTTTLIPMQGYAFKTPNASTTLVFKGNLNTGRAETKAYSDIYTLVGNPFPCPIDWGESINPMGWNNPEDFGSTVWYKVDSEVNSKGNFATYNRAGGGYINGGQRYIPAMKSFWVHSINKDNINDNKIANNIIVNGYVRTLDNTSFLKKRSTNNQLLLRINNGIYYDETMINIHPESEFELETYDSRKMFSEDTYYPQIFTQLDDDISLAINTFPNIQDNLIMPIGVSIQKSGIYNIKAINVDKFDTDLNIYLTDSHSEIITDLKNSSYEFQSDIMNSSDRFSIHFTSETLTDISNLINDLDNINIYSHNEYIYIDLNEYKDAKVIVYNALGVVAFDDKLNSKLSKIKINSGSGIYIVKVQTQDNIFIKKVYKAASK